MDELLSWLREQIAECERCITLHPTEVNRAWAAAFQTCLNKLISMAASEPE